MNTNQHYTSNHFRVEPWELEDVLTRTGLEYKQAGDQFVVKDCPFCDRKGHAIKGKRDNQWKCYFTQESGAHFCHRCGSKGSFYEYKKLMGLISADIQHANGPKKRYKYPEQDKVSTYPMALQWYPDIANYLMNGRKLKKETLDLYRVGAAIYTFQDEAGNWNRDEACVTFPWIERSANGVEFTNRVKARSLANKSNMRLDPAGGRWGLFGWHTVPPEAQEIVICEGEYDAMSVWQATGYPAVSLPNGSRSLPPELLPYFERFQKIFLWMDDDKAGQEGAQEFARKLGDRRTWIVLTRMGRIDGSKDANEALKRGESLQRCLDAAKPVPHQDIITAADLKDDVYREVLNPEEFKGLPFDGFLPSLNGFTGGFRTGEFDLITGQTGMGKTTILSQYSIAMAAQGVNTCWASFEIKNKKLAKKMLYQSAKADLSKYPDRLDNEWNKFAELPLWFMKFFGSTDLAKVLDCMDYLIYVHDVKFFLLDNLQFLLAGQGKGFEKFDIQDGAIDKFRQFATNRNVKVTLVIHPKKISKGFELDNSSFGGTAKATQEADNVYVLQSGPYYRYLDVQKNREFGNLGTIPYVYDPETHLIRELSIQEIEDRKMLDVESGESHGLRTASGGPVKPKRKQRRDLFSSSAPPGPPSEPIDRGKIKNYAPGADGAAIRNSYSVGASND